MKTPFFFVLSATAMALVIVVACLLVSASSKPTATNPCKKSAATSVPTIAVEDLEPTLVTTTYLNLQIQTEHGPIEINCRTGEVVLPEGMKLSEGSRAFWQAVEDAHPWVRQQILDDYPRRRTP